MRNPVLTVAALLLTSAGMASAQVPLTLQISGGRVTIHAQDVPVRTVLAEWARLGGATVVNADRVIAAPLTLELENVPERQALDIILRGVSGYMLAARTEGAPGASMFDRIMILPTSTAPRNPPPAPPVFSGAPGGFQGAPGGIVRPVRPPVVEENDDQDSPDDDNDGLGARPVVVQQRPVANPLGGTPVFPPPTVAPDGNPMPQQVPPPLVVTPGNPFGVPAGSSATPGVITPVPQPLTSPRQQGPLD